MLYYTDFNIVHAIFILKDNSDIIAPTCDLEYVIQDCVVHF